VTEPAFRFVCVPSALVGAPGSWAREMLRDGEIALQADEGGFAAINRVAHELGLVSVAVVRTEDAPERQEQTVMDHAASLPLVWVASDFSERATRWAHDRGPMTLLVGIGGPLPDEERRRIDRFVATLGRQSE
jgi:hypothetical protein